MKRFIIICKITLFSLSVFAQAPEKMSYQAVIRNNSNALVVNQSIGMQVSILQNSPGGNAMYIEKHSPTTNGNGLVSLEIGTGTIVSGNFASIDWSNGTYFIKTETDIAGGVNYTISGTSQLLSVPYALYAKNIKSSVSSTGDTLFIGNQSYIIPGISAANNGSQGGDTNHSCGATDVHNSNLNYGSVTDLNGNVYKTIIIGSQEWMAENLKTSFYSNGAPIPNITNNFQWSSLSSGAWTQYNNNNLYDCPYGFLYNWYAVADARNICPTGWHVPSSDEWNIMIGYLDPNYIANVLGSQSLIVGGKLKSMNSQYWQSPNQDASNETGFSALPGGGRDSNGSFGSIDNLCFFWTSQENGSAAGWSRDISSSSGSIEKYSYDKRVGYSVRCIKD